MNNKKNNRKGFTIVELVIVIAVIAILATVLVPTFGNIIEKANDSKALQEAKNTYTQYVSEIDYAKGETIKEGNLYVLSNGEYFAVANGAVNTTAEASKPTEGFVIAKSGNNVTKYCLATGTAAGCPWCGAAKDANHVNVPAA